MGIIYFYLVIAFLELLLAILVIRKNVRSITHLAFASLAFAFAVWTAAIGVLLSPVVLSVAVTRTFANIMFLTATVVSSGFLMFAWVFPAHDHPLSWPKIVALILPASMIGILLFATDLFVTQVKPGGTLIEKITFDARGYALFSLIFLGNIITAVIILVKKYLASKENQRKQILYLGLGISMALVLGLITHAILPMLGNGSFLWLAPFYPLFFLGTAFFVISRYRLLEIEVILKRTTLYFILVALITGVYTFVMMFLQNALVPAGSPLFIVTLFLVALLVAMTLQPLRNWLDLVTDKVFFKRSYDYYEVLDKTIHEMNTVVKLEDVFEAVARPLIEDMHLQGVGIYLRERSISGNLICRRREGELAAILPELIEEDNPLCAYLAGNPILLETGEFRHRFGHLYSGNRIIDPQKAQVQRVLDSFQAGLILPITQKRNLIGLMMLGDKRSGEQFTQKDLALLDMLAGQMSLTLENIALYEQMLNNERLTIIGTMSASIAHEVRNPLASIKTFIQMLPEKYDKPEFRERFDEIVPAEIERISKITSDLLSFSKPSSLTLEPIELKTLLDRVLTLLSSQVRKKQISILQALEAVPVFQADSQQLSQVMINLLLNAIQASPSKGQIQVIVRTETVQGRGNGAPQLFLSLAIIDEGPGIAKKDRSRLFQPFFTTKTEGTGLGLATCKRIMEAHRGSIRVDSVEGQGASFTILLPIGLNHYALQV